MQYTRAAAKRSHVEDWKGHSMSTQGKFRARSSEAFTLVEVLVVIAIIGVLIGILLPALAAARAQSRITTCLSNVRVQVILVAQYATDYMDALPPRQVWLTRQLPDGTTETAPWLLNRILAEYNGETFPVSGPTNYPVPMGAWRCPGVSPERDSERQTHSGFLHYAPNTWLFNTLVQNEVLGTLTVEGGLPLGWRSKYGEHTWRMLGQVGDPQRIVAIMDNVNYFAAAHGHRDARESYGFGSEVLPLPNPDDFDNLGSHDAQHVRPAGFMDGHADAIAATPASWLGIRRTYRAVGVAGAPPASFYEREVGRLMWFISARDITSDD